VQVRIRACTYVMAAPACRRISGKSSEKASTEIGFDLTSFNIAPGGRAVPQCLGYFLNSSAPFLSA
jgi:hypothetical protein